MSGKEAHGSTGGRLAKAMSGSVDPGWRGGTLLSNTHPPCPWTMPSSAPRWETSAIDRGEEPREGVTQAAAERVILGSPGFPGTSRGGTENWRLLPVPPHFLEDPRDSMDPKRTCGHALSFKNTDLLRSYREEARGRCPTCWFMPQMPTTAKVESGQGQELN